MIYFVLGAIALLVIFGFERILRRLNEINAQLDQLETHHLQKTQEILKN